MGQLGQPIFDLVLANVPRALPAFLRPPGLVMPGLVEFLLPVLPDREAQYQLAHTKRRNRLRRCERVGYTSRIGHTREEIRQEQFDQGELSVRQIGCVAAAEALILTAGGIGPHDDALLVPGRTGSVITY
jgi:hypothetical protein